jgi:hypothetical protein
MTFKVPERIYRTDAGLLVRHGDPRAAFLAFPAGYEMSDEEAQRWGVRAFFDGEKARSAPIVNKMAARPADKSAEKPLVTREKIQ